MSKSADDRLGAQRLPGSSPVNDAWLRSVAYALAWMAVLFGLSSIPGTLSQSEGLIAVLFEWLSLADQSLLHVPAYGFLGFLWARALRSWSLPTVAIAVIAFVITLGYGALDEWYQSTIADRHATMGDLLLDSGGAALGIALCLSVTRVRASSS